jgi:hypothetical protein
LAIGSIILMPVVALAWYRFTGTTPSPQAPSRTVDAELPAPMASAPPTPSTSATRPIASDLARAVAAVGAFDDGRRTTLDDLPAAAHAFIDQARLLLMNSPRRAGPGLPLRQPDGTEMRIAPDPVRSGEAGSVPVFPEGSPAARERARAVDGRLVSRAITISGNRSPVPIRGGLAKEILEPDAWIAVPYDPALVAGQPLELINRSLGRYVLQLDAEDYGSVRLNGGLVVPGRFYLMNGSMTITGDVPVGVMIRPLGVVHGYYDQPVRPPSANG